MANPSDGDDLARLVRDGYCRAVVWARPPVPLDRPATAGAPSPEGLLSSLAVRSDSSWGQCGGAVYMGPFAEALLPFSDLSESFAGVPGWTGTRSWHVRLGRPYAGAAADWIARNPGGEVADVRDGLSVRGPLERLVGAVCDGEPGTVLGRSWPAYFREWVVPHLAAGLSPGDLPRVRGASTLPAGRRTVTDCLRELSGAAGRELTADADLANAEVWAVAEGAATEDLMAAVALALRAEWRPVGGELLFLTPQRLLLAPWRPWGEAGRKDGYPQDPRVAANAIVPVDEAAVSPLDPRVAALTTTLPVLEVASQSADGSEQPPGRLRRLMLVRWAPSTSVTHLLRTAADSRPIHCTAESIEGFAAGVGAPLLEESVASLRSATEGKGALDGNQLVALAQSAGVELVGAKGKLDEIGEKRGIAIVHLTWGHYVAVTDCDSAFVTLLGADGRRARFPKDALESGMSGIMFVSPALLDETPAVLRGIEGLFGLG